MARGMVLLAAVGVLLVSSTVFAAAGRDGPAGTWFGQVTTPSEIQQQVDLNRAVLMKSIEDDNTSNNGSGGSTGSAGGAQASAGANIITIINTANGNVYLSDVTMTTTDSKIGGQVNIDSSGSINQ